VNFAGRILVIDDEKNLAWVIQTMLERDRFEVVNLQDSQRALELLDAEEFDAVVTDLYMPGPSGMEVLKHCRKHLPQLPVVMITAFGTVETAVEALKMGAFDFVTKPFDQTELLQVVRKAVATHREQLKEPESKTLEASVVQNAEKTGSAFEYPPLLQGTSSTIAEVRNWIDRVAQTPSTVLIQGESGTGKEAVAWEIHRRSSRANSAFIRMNTAAIPATLLESELFGFERGAFTGAVNAKPGKFELADRGTLFLDEVAEMSLDAQVKLLRVLQDQKFSRIGSSTEIQVDVRVISACHQNLAVQVAELKFREDLYYRLNVVPIHLPPLRERKEDFENLLAAALASANAKLGREVNQVEPQCLKVMREYRWPGNIRQLDNVVERMVLMGDGAMLRVEDLPDEIRATQDFQSDEAREQFSLKDLVRKKTQEIEREWIERALQETDGNITKAAVKLGLSRKGLQLKLKELGIQRRWEY
jgi:two-component system response regulator AtoC